ncbi:hypothetical protein Tco_0349672 [Tanacetum coccineum]
MPVELGSFDAIISTDWLAKYQAIIVCAEKIVRIPWRNKTLIIHVLRVRFGTCPLKRGLRQVGKKKRLEDVRNSLRLPEVFPKDLPGSPPTRQDRDSKLIYVPVAAPEHWPYRLRLPK